MDDLTDALLLGIFQQERAMKAAAQKKADASKNTAAEEQKSEDLAHASPAQTRAETIHKATTKDAHERLQEGGDETTYESDEALLEKEHDAALDSLDRMEHVDDIENTPILRRLSDWEPRCAHCGTANEYGQNMCDPVHPRICQDEGEKPVTVDEKNEVICDEQEDFWRHVKPDFI